VAPVAVVVAIQHERGEELGKNVKVFLCLQYRLLMEGFGQFSL
jgi:hypothetical protein